MEVFMAFIHSFIKQRSCLRNIACGLALAGMMFTGGSLQAASCDTGANIGNLIGNCGFEDSTTSLPLWTIGGLAANAVPSSAAPVVDGQYAKLTSGNFVVTNLSQNIAVISGMTYNVSFQYLNTPGNGIARVLDSANTVIAGITVPSTAANAWNAANFQFTALSNSTYTLRFVVGTPNFSTLLLDNVIVTAVPEPASMLLLGSLCSAVVGYKFKRKVS